MILKTSLYTGLCLWMSLCSYAQIQPPAPLSLQQFRAVGQQQEQAQNQAAIQRAAPSYAASAKEWQAVQKERETEQLLTHVHAANRQKSLYQTYYQKARDQLHTLVQTLPAKSLKQAVFAVENTFQGQQMTYVRFDAFIQQWVNRMKRYAQHTHQNFAVYRVRYQLLNQFFSQDVRLPDGKTHRAPVYDFTDPTGEENYTHQFVTKLLQTGKGQCHSMPLLYKILADEIGVKAWICFSPSHSYIQFQDENGQRMGFETTNGRLISDSWMMASGYVSRQAIESKIYMDTLSTRQTLLYCLQDLASGYAYLFGYESFVLTTCEAVLKQYPNCLLALTTKADYITMQVKRHADQLGRPPRNQLDQYPELKKEIDYMHHIYAQIDQLGYIPMPKEDYVRWLKSGN